MENNDIISVEIDVTQIPSILQEQFEELKTLKQYVIESTKTAEVASDSAKAAKEKPASFLHKKEAIESLQDATVDLAEAQIFAAQAQQASFTFQQKVAEFTKYLLTLGASNIAVNRCTVRELELRLKEASEEEIDELVRQEILSVIKQLKAQEDIMKKLSDLGEKVKVHELTLRTHTSKDFEYDKKLKENEEHEKQQDSILREHAEKDKEHDRLIATNRQKTIEHDKILAEKEQKDKSQDEEMARQAAVDAKLEKRISAGEERNRIQDEELSRQAVMNAELGRRIEVGEEKDKIQDEEIARQAAKDKELTDMINLLIESNREKEIQIRELKVICENLSRNISDNASVVADKETSILDNINKKASKRAVVISYVVGFVGVMTAIVQFFI